LRGIFSRAGAKVFIADINTQALEAAKKEMPGVMTRVCDNFKRADIASGDWFKGSDDDYKQEASTYIAYTGEFHVAEEAQTITHSMFISLFPNWIGQTQPRVVKIEGGYLYLHTASPIESGRKKVNSYLKWKRATYRSISRRRGALVMFASNPARWMKRSSRERAVSPDTTRSGGDFSRDTSCFR